MKVKGQDLIDFITIWPPGENVYYDDLPYEVREVDNAVCETTASGETGVPVDPALTYEVEGGFLGWQGKGNPPSNFDDDFERVLKKWVKSRTTVTLVLEVPKGKEEFAKAILKEHGWRVR